MATRPNKALSGAQYPKNRNLQADQYVSSGLTASDEQEWLNLLLDYEEDFKDFLSDRDKHFEEITKLSSNKLPKEMTDEKLAAFMYHVASKITARSLQEDVEKVQAMVSMLNISIPIP